MGLIVYAQTPVDSLDVCDVLETDTIEVYDYADPLRVM